MRRMAHRFGWCLRTYLPFLLVHLLQTFLTLQVECGMALPAPTYHNHDGRSSADGSHFASSPGVRSRRGSWLEYVSGDDTNNDKTRGRKQRTKKPKSDPKRTREKAESKASWSPPSSPEADEHNAGPIPGSTVHVPTSPRALHSGFRRSSSVTQRRPLVDHEAEFDSVSAYGPRSASLGEGSEREGLSLSGLLAMQPAPYASALSNRLGRLRATLQHSRGTSPAGSSGGRGRRSDRRGSENKHPSPSYDSGDDEPLLFSMSDFGR